MNFNIIGGGLCGSMVAKEFSNNSIKFNLFESNEKYAASKISENLFSPTWLKGSKYLNESINFLNNNYKVQIKKFKTNKSTQEVYHVPVIDLLWNDNINKKVTSLNSEGLFCDKEFYNGINIICAGYYSRTFIQIEKFNSLTGHGLLFEPNDNNVKIDEVMRHYRPFTHEKIMKWHDGRIWYGDSTTIQHDKYVANKQHYINETLKRAKSIGLNGPYNIYFGARPFINTNEKKLGYYRRINSNTFLLTGGWKDGMVIYPYLVKQLMVDLNKL